MQIATGKGLGLAEQEDAIEGTFFSEKIISTWLAKKCYSLRLEGPHVCSFY